MRGGRILVYGAASNAIENLARARIASGSGFWDQIAGFDISQTLIEYSSRGSTYGRAFWVGLLNTLLVAGIGIVFATILGFAIGISRLSSNWLLAKVAGCYVELIRNLPLLLQLLFWYNAVLKTLPDIRDSISIGWWHLSQQSWLVSADTDFQTRVRRSGNRLVCRDRRRGRLSHLGAQATRADGATSAGVVGHACVGDRAAARDLHRLRVPR